ACTQPLASGSPSAVQSSRRVRLRVRRGAPDQVIERAERRFRALAHGDDDLLERRRGHIARGEHACDRRLAAVIDLNLAARAERDRILQPVAVRQQADLHEYALELDPVQLAGAAVAITQSYDLAVLAVH